MCMCACVVVGLGLCDCVRVGLCMCSCGILCVYLCVWLVGVCVYKSARAYICSSSEDREERDF